MTHSAPAVHLFGIRHHGPGSARSLRQSLERLQPDVILLEGPPEATSVLPLLGEAQMQPPVALLIYAPDNPQLSAFYPFAEFSPEWQAIQYGLRTQTPIRLMDLPQAHQLIPPPEPPEDPEDSESSEQETPHIPTINQIELEVRRDPLLWLAQAAGFSDGERWWEQFVEQRQSSDDVFEGILEAMQALRSTLEAEYPPNPEHPHDHREALREAYMRQTLRQAQKEGFQTIAIVCGAWHTPALSEPLPAAKEDAALLKGLPKAKVTATWVPWTYERLSLASGYGAGIKSPGWYDHLWRTPDQIAMRWLIKVAHLLRQQDLDASSANVIEAVRLAETLAALRDYASPSLVELNESVQTVLCCGDTAPMQLIQRQLLVGERLGAVPHHTPMVPLQQDLQRYQQRLRLKPSASKQTLELDLRKPNDLERSQLLHRLLLLNIHWGEPSHSSGKGTFKEQWQLHWQPELEIALIEAGCWGNTILNAATACANDQAQQARELPQLTTLLETVLLATLPTAVEQVMQQLGVLAALSSDMLHLMAALPPLANIVRYSDVRQTDVTTITQVVTGLMTRICIGLPMACASLDDDAASQMVTAIGQTHQAINLLQTPAYRQDWLAMLHRLAAQNQLHGLLAGRCCRLLLDEGELDGAAAAKRLSLALSLAVEPSHAAAWIDGFLQGSGLLLLHDPAIWPVLDDWVISLNPDAFVSLLPLLRRTFSQFTPAERRQMRERARPGQGSSGQAPQSSDLDHERASQVFPLVAQLLGLPLPV
jgi:hypothetical protein